MIKDMITIGNKIKIESYKNIIKFICIADGVYSREVEFGIFDDEEDNLVLSDQAFYVDQLHKIIKMSGLDSKLYIHISNKNPLKIACNIGSIGKINIYLKSIDQLKQDEIN